MNVVTRFAPSPTGLLHVGNYRTAVFAYLFSRHEKGKFVLRIEDTDRKRSQAEYEDNILESLTWLHLDYDAMYRQSDHTKRHEEILQDLVKKDIAYLSKETPEGEGERSEVIRFRNPGKVVTFNDTVRGEVSMDTSDLGDFVIARSFTEPVFHFANVVDDWEEGVTHIIRGEDHISNTPRQILIQEAVGAPRPTYSHLPLVLAPDRSKLSKRKGARSLLEYRDLGYLPQALLNYLALLGWHPGTDEEIFTREELTQRFTLDQIQKAGAMFDEVKLKWFNREHLLRLTPEAFWEHAEEFLSEETVTMLDAKGLWKDVVEVMRERIQTLGDLSEMDKAGEFSYFYTEPTPQPQALLWKKNPDAVSTKERLTKVLELLQAVSEGDWTQESVRSAVFPYAEEEGRGEVLWPMRFALSGREKSPDPFVIAGIIGKDETEKRVKNAIEIL